MSTSELAQQTSVTPRLGHLRALDGLRALSIAGVVFSHLGVPYLIGGAIGVQIFFVLSGFLITTVLLQEFSDTGRLHLGRFTARRGLRLYPALLLVLLAWAGYLKTHPDLALHAATKAGLLPSLLYYANWSCFFGGYSALGWLGPLWSLAVEEQFYLLWPVTLLVFLTPRLRRYLPAALITTCALVLAFRFHDLWAADRTYRRFGTHEISDQLLIGCLLALLLHRPAGGRERLARLSSRLLPFALLYLVVLVGTLGNRPPLLYHRFIYTIGLTLIGLCAAVVIAHLVLHPQGRLVRLLTAPPLPWLGTLSYGIYLWHEFVRMLTTQTGTGVPLMPRWEQTILVVAGSVALAAASYYGWERPFLRLKGRLGPPPPVQR